MGNPLENILDATDDVIESFLPGGRVECPKCGEEIDADETECPECGAEL